MLHNSSVNGSNRKKIQGIEIKTCDGCPPPFFIFTQIIYRLQTLSVKRNIHPFDCNYSLFVDLQFFFYILTSVVMLLCYILEVYLSFLFVCTESLTLVSDPTSCRFIRCLLFQMFLYIYMTFVCMCVYSYLYIIIFLVLFSVRLEI